jgi:hypothetical protein
MPQPTLVFGQGLKHPAPGFDEVIVALGKNAKQ